MTPEQRAHKLTDDAITALERRISVVYKQANEDVTEKLNTYMERFKRLDEQKLKQVTDGVLSQADYKQWRVGKIAIGENWKAIQNNLAQDYVNADKIAASIINGDMANVYALNHNYAAYALESGTNMNLQFTLYDKSTVEGLLKENKNLLPQRKIDVPKDLRWNKQKIQSAVTQGILQGEPIDKIANRLQQVTDMNHNAAVRNARTAATGAENAGRQDTYDEAVSKGIKLKKEWLATLDSRTRDAHQQLDGQRVEEDKPFKSEFGDIMYPGDPSADPANVYNCRCSMIAVVEGVEEIAKAVGEYQPRMTYSEWERAKSNEFNADIESISKGQIIENIKNLGFTDKIDLEGLDKKDVEIAQKTISEIKNKYPDMPDVPTITYDANAKFYGAMDNASLMPDGRFTGQQLTIGNINGNKELFERTLWHEYGHLYINKLNADVWLDKMQGDWFEKYADSVIKQSYSNEILKQVKREMKKDGLVFNVNNISSYATKNIKSKPNEVVAEAFSIFNTSKGAVSDEIKYILRHLR